MRLIDADKIIQISIHVPAWGTTDGTYAVLTDQGISIHVPAWGTTYHHHGITHNRQFQSTFPRGERRRTVWHQQSIICQFQSTFPRGERPDMRRCYQKNKNFNPRSRVGNDTLFLFHASAKPISIHVPAWGTTYNFLIFFQLYWHFNPRSRVGNDEMPKKQSVSQDYFNPRSRVGNDGWDFHSGI